MPSRRAGGSRAGSVLAQLTRVSGWAGIALVVFVCILLSGMSRPAAGQTAAKDKVTPAISPFIDAHVHFDQKVPDAAAAAAVKALATQNAIKVLVLVSPFRYDDPDRFEVELLLKAAKKYPGKIGVIGGGGTLNAMIQQAVDTGDAGPDIQKKFKDRAEEMFREGIVAYGEMTTEHFPSANAPAYQYAPADHPLYLLLDDIAAQHGIPIDLHMEAVPEDMPLPKNLKSPPNPPQLHGNIAALERLLDHNPRAVIVWAHAGTDNSGFRTPDLDRRLLQAHPNLYMEIKTDPVLHGANYPMDESGKIKPDWLKLLQDFPDRFLLGSDQKYPEPADGPQRWQTLVSFFNQLPDNLRRKIGIENAQHVYNPNARVSSAPAKPAH